MRAEQLRELFGLPVAEELYGCYLCAHTRPRWGSQFLQGQLYVFSSCMVFHANLIAVVKVVRIHFKDVKVIRKRSFLRLPNTIAVERFDEAGEWHDDVFTSFVFSTRRRAYGAMVERWRAVNPLAAEAYLGPELSNPEDTCFTPGCLSDGDGGAAGGPGGAAGGPSAHQQQQQQQQHPPEAAFPVILASLAVPAAQLPQPPPDVAMALVGSSRLACDAHALAQVLLGDTSGFLPHVMASQGNQLLTLTPWQVVPGGAGGAGGGTTRLLGRSFSYLYSAAGAWGPVRSRVLQRQLLGVGQDGRLVLGVSQSMPDLPTGVGKCFNVHIRWEVTPIATAAPAAPAAPAAAADGGHGTPAPPGLLSCSASPAPTRPASAAATPRSSAAAAAAEAASWCSSREDTAAAAAADGDEQRQQQSAAPAACAGASLTPFGTAAAASPAPAGDTGEGSGAASAGSGGGLMALLDAALGGTTAQDAAPPPPLSPPAAAPAGGGGGRGVSSSSSSGSSNRDAGDPPGGGDGSQQAPGHHQQQHVQQQARHAAGCTLTSAASSPLPRQQEHDLDHQQQQCCAGDETAGQRARASSCPAAASSCGSETAGSPKPVAAGSIGSRLGSRAARRQQPQRHRRGASAAIRGGWAAGMATMRGSFKELRAAASLPLNMVLRGGSGGNGGGGGGGAAAAAGSSGLGSFSVGSSKGSDIGAASISSRTSSFFAAALGGSARQQRQGAAAAAAAAAGAEPDAAAEGPHQGNRPRGASEGQKQAHGKACNNSSSSTNSLACLQEEGAAPAGPPRAGSSRYAPDSGSAGACDAAPVWDQDTAGQRLAQAGESSRRHFASGPAASAPAAARDTGQAAPDCWQQTAGGQAGADDAAGTDAGAPAARLAGACVEAAAHGPAGAQLGEAAAAAPGSSGAAMARSSSTGDFAASSRQPPATQARTCAGAALDAAGHGSSGGRGGIASPQEGGGPATPIPTSPAAVMLRSLGRLSPLPPWGLGGGTNGSSNTGARDGSQGHSAHKQEQPPGFAEEEQQRGQQEQQQEQEQPSRAAAGESGLLSFVSIDASTPICAAAAVRDASGRRSAGSGGGAAVEAGAQHGGSQPSSVDLQPHAGEAAARGGDGDGAPAQQQRPHPRDAASDSATGATLVRPSPAAAGAAASPPAAAPPRAPAAAAAAAPGATTSPASAAAAVQWRVLVAVEWHRWHIAQSKITNDTLAATTASLQQLMETGEAWVAAPGARLSLAAVMPAAHPLSSAALVAARRAGGHSRLYHRRSGSAGSVRLRDAAGPLLPPPATPGPAASGGAPAAGGGGLQLPAWLQRGASAAVERWPLLGALASVAGLLLAPCSALLGGLVASGCSGCSSLGCSVGGGCRRAAGAAYQQRGLLLGLGLTGVLLGHAVLLWRMLGVLGRIAAALEAVAGALGPQQAAAAAAAVAAAAAGGARQLLSGAFGRSSGRMCDVSSTCDVGSG